MAIPDEENKRGGKQGGRRFSPAKKPTRSSPGMENERADAGRDILIFESRDQILRNEREG